MPGGHTLQRKTSVEGSKDKPVSDGRRLTAQILALGAGAGLTNSALLPRRVSTRLKLYLDGVAAYRRGAFYQSTSLLSQAVQLDSTFALGLSELIASNGWSESTPLDMDRVVRLAWSYRDRLSPRDRTFLSLRLRLPISKTDNVDPTDCRLGASGPSHPESPDAWFYLADALFHCGALADIPDHQLRARKGLRGIFRAIPSTRDRYNHLAPSPSSPLTGAALRRWTVRALAIDTTYADVLRWNLASGTRDEKESRQYWRGPTRFREKPGKHIVRVQCP
jgi:hypothetical protein